MFKIHKTCKYGREEVCKYCHNEFKDTKHPPNYKHKELHPWFRKCKMCGLEANTKEELSEFKTSKRSEYGRLNYCISCHNKKWVKPWINKHPEAIKRKNNNYDSDPIKYHCRLVSANYPLKSQCEKCGSKIKLQRHHPDHSKPKEFITLCLKCHNKLNRKPIKF
jgi:hypothetical protein